MIGFDLEHISKIKNAERLLDKLATSGEKAYIAKFQNKSEKIATLWSVKEAVFKCLDIKSGEISFQEIELKHKENGKPYVELTGKAKARLNALGAKGVEISLSHSLDLVGAVAIIVF